MSLTVGKLLVRAARVVAPVLIMTALLAIPCVTHAQAPGENVGQAAAAAAPAEAGGGEANLKLPDLSQVEFRGVKGSSLLMGGLVVAALGLVFGLVVFTQLKNLPVHT